MIRLRIMKKTSLFIIFMLLSSLCLAQVDGYDERVNLGNNLFKVKSGDFYGIVDINDRVVVSIEFKDIIFNENKALLITHNGTLYGIVDNNGTVTTLNEGKSKSSKDVYIVHPKYQYVSDGYIIVGKKGRKQWGYISEDGKPLNVKGTFLKSIIKGQMSMFDEVTPFIDGCAAVCTNNHWKHIDKNGEERYRLSDKKEKAVFRSSLYDKECIIVTDKGIKLCQENSNYEAVVKRVLTDKASYLNHQKGRFVTKLMFYEGTLTIDSLNRVTKFTSQKDSVVFIKENNVIKEVEKDVKQTSSKESLQINQLYKVISTGENGMARSVTQIINTSDNKLEDVTVIMKCNGAKREWKGSISNNKDLSLYLDIPARFSEVAVKCEITVEVHHDGKVIVKETFPLTIKRYTPDR